MDAIVQQVVDRVHRDRPRLIAVTEPNHYSRSSHRFHFDLLKKLVQENCIDIISSERLGLFDAILMNAWIDGRLTGSARNLFKNVLPLGGLGTLRWLRWLKKQHQAGRRHRLVGFEADFWYFLNRNGPTNPRTLQAVKSLASPEFARRIRRLDKVPTNPPIRTNTDLEILRALETAQRHRYDYDSRFDIWTENMAKHPQARIFMNGFHLARGEEVGPRISGRHLLIGMASYNRFVPTQTITRNWLSQRRLTLHDFETGSVRFWTKYYNYMRNRHPVGYRAPYYSERVKNISRFIEPTRLERQHKNSYALVDTSSQGLEYISQSGWDTLPIMRGKMMRTDHPAIRKPITKFDLVVFIPRSTFHVDMES